ncbi:DUF4129 domain-containing protein [Bacillus sp. JCM 19034]|uniref:DUF4129 domain-containing protein n=1 Tax=Bacillus sp. JCM 19034 TaxID=1481928 RepID=UPI0007831C4C|nr:DUF4129 domain-containing protein [Bacillus sp. JCM 19034]
MKTLVNRLLPGDDRTDGVNIYIDEKESLLNVKSWFKNKANNVIQFVTTVSERRIKWSLLTNSEKVRYIYREMVMGQIKRGFVYRKDLTAHEVLSKIKMKQTEDSQSLQKLDQLYNAARYSDKPIEERKVMEVEKIGMKQ